MKEKILLLMIITTMTILLCSCSLGSWIKGITDDEEGHFFVEQSASGGAVLGRRLDDGHSYANGQMEKVLKALQQKDKETLTDMFSKTAIAKEDDWEKSLDELFDYYQGEYISYDDWGGPGSGETVELDKIEKDIESTYDVKTSVGEYRFSLFEYTENTFTEANVGIMSLYIIKMEDDTDQKSAYWGDGKNTPGINIGKTWPGEEKK